MRTEPLDEPRVGREFVFNTAGGGRARSLPLLSAKAKRKTQWKPLTTEVGLSGALVRQTVKMYRHVIVSESSSSVFPSDL